MSEEGVKNTGGNSQVCHPEKTQFFLMMNKQNWKWKLNVWEKHEPAKTLYLTT